MPQRDTYHDAVKRALIADGWVITHDPLILAFGTRDVYVDLGAEGPIAADKEGRKIAVEVKSFLGVSEVTDLERALGQYELYGFLLEEKEPERALYLAITDDAFESLFADTVGQRLLARAQLKLVVVDVWTEAITRWTE